MPTYVFADGSYSPEVIVVEATNEAEARGKAVEANYGINPRGAPKLLDDVLGDDGAAKLA